MAGSTPKKTPYFPQMAYWQGFDEISCTTKIFTLFSFAQVLLISIWKWC
jgi:hypothetical protein